MDQQHSVICSIVFSEIVNIAHLAPQERTKRLQSLQQIINGLPGITGAATDILLSQTDDGLAIVFFNNPENALFFSLYLHRALNEYNAERKEAFQIHIRTGINLGTIYAMTDELSERQRVVGDGMNTAQRIMSFAEAHHLLCSQSFRNCIAPVRKTYLQLFQPAGLGLDKHGKQHVLFNIYTRDTGNSRLPQACRQEGFSATVPQEGQPESSVILREEIRADICCLLFVDVVGFSKLYNDVQKSTIQNLNQLVTQSESMQGVPPGSRIVRSTGDGALVAFFKAPEMALLLAFEIRTGLREGPYAVRMGIHLGLVERTRDIDGHEDVTGQAKDLAKTVMDFGEAGHILLTKDTYALLSAIGTEFSRCFEYYGWYRSRDGDTLELYGASPPGVPALLPPQRGQLDASSWTPALNFSIGGAQVAAGSKDQVQPAIPLIGRQKEQTWLVEVIGKLKNGEGSTVFIAGEAGIGKTRLIQEMEVMSRQHWIAFYGSEAEKFLTQVIPLVPFKEIVKRIAQERLISQVPLSADSLRQVLTALDPDLAHYALTLACDFLNLEERVPGAEPLAQRERLFYALKALFESLARQKPLIIFIDDIHWADALTLDLWLYLANALQQCPIAFVTAFRREEQEALQRLIRLLSRNKNFSMGSLERFSAGETRSLLEHMLPQQDLPAKFFRFVHQETEGIPFYIQALIDMLKREEVLARHQGQWILKKAFDAVKIPDTIENLILEKLAQMEEPQLERLKYAAVIGKVFLPETWLQILPPHNRDGLEEDIEVFLQGQILKEKGIYLEFNHIKIQEVLYQNAGSERKKRQLHQRIGLALEALVSPGPELHPLLASHFYKAGEADKAFPYLLRTGQQARAVYAQDEALWAFQRAWEMQEILQTRGAGVSAAAKIEVLESLGSLYRKKTDWPEAEKYLTMACQIARQEQDSLLTGRMLLRLGELYQVRGQLAEAESHYQQSLSLANPISRLLEAEALQALGSLHADRSNWEAAMACYLQSQQLAQAIGDTTLLHALALKLAQVFYSMGEWDRACSLLFQCEKYYFQNKDLWQLEATYRTLANLARAQGHLAKANAYYKQEKEILEELGDEQALATYYYNQGNMAVDHNQLETAMALYQKSRTIYEKLADWQGLGCVHNNLGEVLRLQGGGEQAIAHFEAAREIGKQLKNIQMVVYSYINIGETYQGQQDFSTARQYYQEALQLQFNDPFALGYLLHKMALACHTQADYQQALEYYQESMVLFEELGNTTMLLSLYEAMGDVRQLMAQPGEALVCYRKGLELAGPATEEHLIRLQQKIAALG